MPRQVFRFHDIAAVSVASDSAFVNQFFEAEYGYHASEPRTVIQHRTDAELQPAFPRAALNFHLGGGAPAGFTQHVHKVLARWDYRIKLQPGAVDLDVYGNQAAVAMVHHMLVHPSLRWLAANHDTLLLHAGAVAKNGQSLIFTGKGGAGKTTTTSLVLASGEGWQIHADDYVFLGAQSSQAYVTRSHLYRDLLNWVPEVRSRLTAWEGLRLEFFGALRKYSREGLKWPVRLSPQRLWPGTPIAPIARPAAILLLERADVPAPLLKPVNSLDETAADLLEMNFGEARHFLTLLRKANALDDRWLAAWKDQEANLIGRALQQTATRRLILPYSQSARGAQSSLMPLLDGLIK